MKKLSFYHTPLHSTPPLGGFPSEYRHPLWYGKTRMVSLPDGEKISKICLFVLTWSTNVLGGQTDRQTLHDSIDRACIASRGKNSVALFFVDTVYNSACSTGATISLADKVEMSWSSERDSKVMTCVQVSIARLLIDVMTSRVCWLTSWRHVCVQVSIIDNRIYNSRLNNKHQLRRRKCHQNYNPKKWRTLQMTSCYWTEE